MSGALTSRLMAWTVRCREDLRLGLIWLCRPTSGGADCRWVIDQLPEMEKAFRIEILEPRGSTFPQSDDLALRAPKPRKPVPW
jgi:hypothetical protein